MDFLLLILDKKQTKVTQDIFDIFDDEFLGIGYFKGPYSFWFKKV